MPYPVIIAEDCIACGACVDACPMDVIEVEDIAVAVNKDDCIGCGACIDACPVDAISEIAD